MHFGLLQIVWTVLLGGGNVREQHGINQSLVKSKHGIVDICGRIVPGSSRLFAHVSAEPKVGTDKYDKPRAQTIKKYDWYSVFPSAQLACSLACSMDWCVNIEQE